MDNVKMDEMGLSYPLCSRKRKKNVSITIINPLPVKLVLASRYGLGFFEFFVLSSIKTRAKKKEQQQRTRPILGREGVVIKVHTGTFSRS